MAGGKPQHRLLLCVLSVQRYEQLEKSKGLQMVKGGQQPGKKPEAEGQQVQSGGQQY